MRSNPALPRRAHPYPHAVLRPLPDRAPARRSGGRTRFPFRHMERFRQLEREARTNRRGLWGTAVGGSADSSQAAPAGVPRTVYVTKTGTKYHLDGCRFLSKSRIPMPRDEAVQRYELCGVCATRLRSKR